MCNVTNTSYYGKCTYIFYKHITQLKTRTWRYLKARGEAHSNLEFRISGHSTHTGFVHKPVRWQPRWHKLVLIYSGKRTQIDNTLAKCTTATGPAQNTNSLKLSSLQRRQQNNFEYDVLAGPAFFTRPRSEISYLDIGSLLSRYSHSRKSLGIIISTMNHSERISFEEKVTGG